MECLVGTLGRKSITLLREAYPKKKKERKKTKRRKWWRKRRKKERRNPLRNRKRSKTKHREE